MILDLVPNFDPVLHTPTPEFDFENAPINPVELYQNLAETMLSKGGIGLAAPQCGLPYNFFVVRSDPVMGFFNCRIVDKSDQTTELEEGCLSYKNLILKVTRASIIKARWEMIVPGQRISVETKTQIFSGMTARVIQHELDHVNGIVFTKYVNKYHLEQARNKARKLNKVQREKEEKQILIAKAQDGGKTTTDRKLIIDV